MINIKITKIFNIASLKAMSLIEIIVTITIVFILGTMSMYSYQDYKIKAQYNSALITAEQTKLAISNYYAKNKQCPGNNFITQNLNSNSYVTNISNTGCTLNLKNPSGNTVILFQAFLSALGDLQYFCVLGATNKPSLKHLSVTCNASPLSPSPPTGYTNP